MNRVSELTLSFLVNAAWQVMVVTLVAGVCARLMHRAAARYRHALWLAALVFCLALPLWSILSPSGEEARPAIAAQPGVTVQPRQIVVASRESTLSESAADAHASGSSAFDRLLLRRHRQSLPAAPGLLFALALCYALFLLYRAGSLWRAWRRAKSIRQSGYERKLSPPLAEAAARCLKAFGLESVPLMCSPSVTAPITVGALRPVIILPESFYAARSGETLASIVGHEAAHVARRDYSINLVCELLSLPLSFHPLAGYIKRQINRTRELACDELVTERLRLEPRTYARALVRVADAISRPASRALTMGIFDADILEERIMKLTQNRKRLGARSGRLFAFTALSLLCLSCLTISTFSFDLRTGSASAGAAVSRTAVRDVTNESGNPYAPQSVAKTPDHVGAQAQNQSATAETPAQVAQESASRTPQERARAACEAGRRRDVELIPALVRMLNDDAPIPLMRCWDGGRWSPALDSFKQPSPGEQAAIALASMGTPALGPLTNALNDANASVRRNAAWAIGELTNMRGGERSAAVEPLVSLLNDGDEWVRMAAARALGEIRDERAAESLIALLNDAEWRVRGLAAWALSEMKEERAVGALCRVLISDGQVEVRRAAAEALGEIRSQKALSFLRQAANDAESSVREKAKWAIAEIEDSDG